MRLAALFVLALAVAACDSPEEQMEDEVRNLLSQRGNVQEADLAQGADGNMTGHATVAGAGGQTSRYNCSATKAEGTRFNINCIPAIDEAMLTAIEADIRRLYEQRGAEVLEVDMQKQDEDHISGHMIARDGGMQARLVCSAERNTADGQFPWQCVPEGETAGGSAPGTAAPAPDAGGAGGKVPAGGEAVDGEGGK